MSIWSLVPIKSFKRPKSRLNDVLSLEQRRLLVKQMLVKILRNQINSNLFVQNLVVTEDEEVISFIKKFGVKGILQKKPGLNQGITEAVSFSIKNNAKSILILHGDIPEVDKDSLVKITNFHNNLIKRHGKGITLSSDVMGSGSNCMICTPPDAIKFCYGIDSCSSHLEEADKRGVKIKLFQSKKFAFDIDVYSDLSSFLKRNKYNDLEDYLLDL